MPDSMPLRSCTSLSRSSCQFSELTMASAISPRAPLGVVMPPEAREDFVVISYVLEQDRNCFFLCHSVQGLAATVANRCEQRRLLVSLKLGLLDALAEIIQTAALLGLR